MPRPLIKIRPDSLNVDLPPSDVAPNEYTFGDNIQFRDGYAARSLGWSAFAPQLPAGIEPQFLLNVVKEGTNWWLAGCDDGIYVTNTTSWFNITPAGFTTGKTPEQWSGGLLNGIPIINYQEGAPQYWDFNTGNVTQDIPDFLNHFDKCEYIGISKFHCFALQPTEAGDLLESKVAWSDATEPGQVGKNSWWTPGANSEAGDVLLSDTRDPILAAVNLRGQLAVYKANSTYLMTYIGGTFIWDTRLLFSNQGILAPRAVVDLPGGRHAMLTDGDVVVHDGQTAQSIVDRRWRRTIFNLIDPDNYLRSFAVHDQRNSEVLFCIPQKGATDPTIAVAWNYYEDKIGIRDLAPSTHGASGIVTESTFDPSWNAQTDTWDSYVGAWNQSRFNPADDGVLISNATNRQVYYLDGAEDQDGVSHETVVRKEMMDFDAPGSRKLITAIWPRMVAQAGQTVQVRVGSADHPDTPITWGSYVDYLPDSDDFVPYIAEGRFLSFEFRTTEGNTWSLIGFDVEAEILGQY